MCKVQGKQPDSKSSCTETYAGNILKKASTAFSDSSPYSDKIPVAGVDNSNPSLKEEILVDSIERNTHKESLSKKPPTCNQTEGKVKEEIHAHDILNRIKQTGSDTGKNIGDTSFQDFCDEDPNQTT